MSAVPKATAIADLDFATLLRAGDGLVIAQMAGEPLGLVERLYATRGLPAGVSGFIGANVSGAPLAADPADIRFSSYGALFRTAELGKRAPVTMYPLHYSRIGPAIESGAVPSDVVLMQVVRDDASGRLYLAGGMNYLFEAARKARMVIAELNPRAPVVAGSELPDDLRIDIVVEGARDLPTQAYAQPGEDEKRIGALVASLVADGDTIQVGVGSLAGAMLSALSGHRHLGFHSGLLNDDIMRLMRSGAIDNSRKSIDAGVSVFGNQVGSAELYAFCHRNPLIRAEPASYTHVAPTLARVDRLIALNSGLQVDLAGQVNAEAAGSRYLGGVGGLADFVRGARLGRGGRAVIAMPSCAKGGAISRIVARLDGPATLGAPDADCIVTEFGIAHLRDKSLPERARAVIAIAHPDHREALSAAAREARLI